VRDSIEQALLELSSEQSLEDAHRDELIIDQDRKGVPGTPDLAITILQKIDKCAIFVADVSIVGDLSNGKGVINSNVAIELGYALKAKGNERILMIANEAFTARERLPFDLKHKAGPIFFNLPDQATNQEIVNEKSKFVGILKNGIRDILVSERAPSKIARHPPIASQQSRMYFNDGEILYRENSRDAEVIIAAKQKEYFYIRIIPTLPSPDLKRAEAKEIISSISPMLRRSHSSYFGPNEWGAISVAIVNSDKTLMSAAQLFLNREIWSFECYLVNRQSKDSERNGVPTGEHEFMFIEAVNKYFECARKKLSISLPIEIELGMIGGKGNFLFMGSEYFEPYWGPFHDDEVVVKREIKTDSIKEREDVCLEFFERLFDSAAHIRPKNFNNIPNKV
jgi:hypothetical protein